MINRNIVYGIIYGLLLAGAKLLNTSLLYYLALFLLVRIFISDITEIQANSRNKTGVTIVLLSLSKCFLLVSLDYCFQHVIDAELFLVSRIIYGLMIVSFVIAFLTITLKIQKLAHPVNQTKKPSRQVSFKNLDQKLQRKISLNFTLGRAAYSIEDQEDTYEVHITEPMKHTVKKLLISNLIVLTLLVLTFSMMSVWVIWPIKLLMVFVFTGLACLYLYMIHRNFTNAFQNQLQHLIITKI